jgi:hypothetical protein
MPLGRDLTDAVVAVEDFASKDKPILSVDAGDAETGKPVLRSVNIRYPISIYNNIGEMAGRNGMSRADFCRKASIWMLKEIKAGRLDISGGVITDKRR